MRHVLWVLGAGALVACSTDEFASSDAGDGGPADVAVDRATQDASNDGASDATIDAVDAWAPPAPIDCNKVSGALLCADFEKFSVDQGWTTTNQVGNGTLALDATQFYSSSHSAASTLPGFQGPAAAELAFAWSDPGAAQAVTLRYAFRVETKVAVRISLLTFTAQIGTAKYALSVTGQQELMLDVSDGNGAQGVQIGYYAIGTWNHVSLEVRPSTNPGFTVSLDGTQKSGSGPAALGNAKNRDIRVGAQLSVASNVPTTVRFDDVLYTAQ